MKVSNCLWVRATNRRLTELLPVAVTCHRDTYYPPIPDAYFPPLAEAQPIRRGTWSKQRDRLV